MATITFKKTGERMEGGEQVRQFLNDLNVLFENWDVTKLAPELREKCNLSDGEKETVLENFIDEIKSLATRRGYVKWDVIALSEAIPNLGELLQKFQQVHTHSEDEVRAIVAGRGIFIIKGPEEAGYFAVELEPGDVISVPENTPHYFTLTEERQVVAVRLFIDPSGWVANPYLDAEFEATK